MPLAFPPLLRSHESGKAPQHVGHLLHVSRLGLLGRPRERRRRVPGRGDTLEDRCACASARSLRRLGLGLEELLRGAAGRRAPWGNWSPLLERHRSRIRPRGSRNTWHEKQKKTRRHVLQHSLVFLLHLASGQALLEVGGLPRESLLLLVRRSIGCSAPDVLGAVRTRPMTNAAACLALVDLVDLSMFPARLLTCNFSLLPFGLFITQSAYFDKRKLVSWQGCVRATPSGAQGACLAEVSPTEIYLRILGHV